MYDEEKLLLRDYQGKTNLQRAKTKYHQHLFEWFSKTFPLQKEARQAVATRTFKSIVFEDPNTEIELGPATYFKGAGELLELAEEMKL